MQHITAAVT